MPSVTIRIPDDTLQRIDANAERECKTRTDYILSWLPEHYDEPAASKTPNSDTNHGTKPDSVLPLSML